MKQSFRHYLLITMGYWAFTITDGAIRMLVVLYFHLLGYSPFEVAMLFLFYEFFGVITNLLGAWLGGRVGLNRTMHLGMALQVIALLMLTVPTVWLSVPYVMFAQALSGIAKDLNKMSAKASVKMLIKGDSQSSLFKWVAVLTGSKNALKGAGFFIGAGLLEIFGFRFAVGLLAGLLLVVLMIMMLSLPNDIGKLKSKPKFSEIFSQISAINQLALARFFLFGSRDVWFVVGLPVFLYETLEWRFIEVGAFLSLWVIAYGIVQASVPVLMKGKTPSGKTAQFLALGLAVCPIGIAFSLQYHEFVSFVLVVGLVLYGIIFAINSSVHSYLILSYSDHDKVAMNVGFYYMANAGGRLTGTILSGFSYQLYGLEGCLLVSFLFTLLAAVISTKLPGIK